MKNALPSSTEAVAQRCSVKKMFWNISQNSLEKTCARVSFLIKLQAEVCNFIKKGTLAQVHSCEFYEISKNTFSYKTSPVAASACNKFIMVEKMPPQIIHKTLLWTYITLHRKLRIWSHLLEKSLMDNFIFCAVIQSFIRNYWDEVVKSSKGVVVK